MKEITIKNKLVFGGKPIKIWSPMSMKETNTQIAEIFLDQHYQEGKIKKDMVILDVGANIGMSAIYFKDYAKEIYALEPVESAYEALVHNTQRYPNIKPFKVGLANYKGTDVMFSNDEGETPFSFWGNGGKRETVEITTISDFMAENNLKHIDLMKVDVEGSEYVIFPSIGFTSVADKIDYIIGEGHFVGQSLMPDYIKLILEDNGFDVKFLPYDNLFITMNFDNGAEIKQYRLSKQTMFFAKRKSLKWP